MAFSAALTALSSPSAIPIPIRAAPWFCMTLRTSAKSRLTSAGTAIRSEMVCTPCLSTLSAAWNASSIGRRPMTSSRLLLDTMIRESVYFCSSLRPDMALRSRFLPSKVKGLVTMPMVSAPSSLATFANSGAAPVPVPPPRPAVRKTMSLPLMASRISFSVSSAALRPTSGLPPAPSPFVVSRPKTILFSQSEFFITCTSVLAM